MITWPSAGALSNAWTPMPPPAPGRLSTITGCFRSFISWSPITRAITSIAPPAGAGTMIRRGLSLAAYVSGAASARSAAHAARRFRSIRFMAFSHVILSG